MNKDERIGFRVPTELKNVIFQIAKKEGRSLAQVCEIFLRGGISAYRKQGSKYMKRFVFQAERHEE
jgi:hypothetical protein